MNASIPPWVLDLISSCPTAGQEVNPWLFRVARILNPVNPDKPDLAVLLRAASRKCGREVLDSEISRAIANSEQSLLAGRRGLLTARRRWPKPNAETIAEAIKNGPGILELRGKSPVPFADQSGSRAEEVIDALFPGNPLLCVGGSNRVFNTLPRQQWRGTLERQQLIVPSPMSRMTAKKQEGKISLHALSNTGPRRFLVIEFDPPKWESLDDGEKARLESEEKYYRAKRDQHAALHFHLGQRAPLVMVVYSGGKSLHGWYFCAGQEEGRLQDFMARASFLGADPATWTKSQFVRLPEGRRDNGKLQSVIY